MKTKDDIDRLERLIVQLNGLHSEISQLAKKAPNVSVNKFKLKLINNVLAAGNAVLGDDYRPFAEFTQFDVDDVPTNSDVTMILSQYIEQTERFRSDNVVSDDDGFNWYYKLRGKTSEFEAAPPTLIGSRK